MKRGILYGVGVGPGDPELLTLKARRILSEADVIAVPDKGSGEKTALNIVKDYIQDKPLHTCAAPMVRDPAGPRSPGWRRRSPRWRSGACGDRG